jgi:hypothetical protein
VPGASNRRAALRQGCAATAIRAGDVICYRAAGAKRRIGSSTTRSPKSPVYLSDSAMLPAEVREYLGSKKIGAWGGGAAVPRAGLRNRRKEKGPERSRTGPNLQRRRRRNDVGSSLHGFEMAVYPYEYAVASPFQRRALCPDRAAGGWQIRRASARFGSRLARFVASRLRALLRFATFRSVNNAHAKAATSGRRAQTDYLERQRS